MYKEVTTKTIAKKRYSFKKGYLKVSLAEKETLRKELIEVLGNPSRHYFSTKLNKGILEISVTLYNAITDIFNRYDIFDIWDITEE